MAETLRVEGVAMPAEGHAVRCVADGATIAVFRAGGAFYALEARCTHAGGPLDQGTVTGDTVRCPWHGSVFHLATGAVQQGPAAKPVRAYRARWEGTSLLLDPATPPAP
jgi:nitrite reductase/ring-hydroxylating ferredoxin subunit